MKNINLPHQVEYFTGFSSYLEDITNPTKNYYTLNLYGEKGIGKTAIATQAAYENIDNFDNIIYYKLDEYEETPYDLLKYKLLPALDCLEFQDNFLASSIGKTSIAHQFLKESRTFLVVDNADNMGMGWVELVREFTKSKSKLLLVSSTDLKISKRVLRVVGATKFDYMTVLLAWANRGPYKSSFRCNKNDAWEIVKYVDSMYLAKEIGFYMDVSSSYGDEILSYLKSDSERALKGMIRNSKGDYN